MKGLLTHDSNNILHNHSTAYNPRSLCEFLALPERSIQETNDRILVGDEVHQGVVTMHQDTCSVEAEDRTLREDHKKKSGSATPVGVP
jgi:hypothetical protein